MSMLDGGFAKKVCIQTISSVAAAPICFHHLSSYFGHVLPVIEVSTYHFGGCLPIAKRFALYRFALYQ
jgi:hypothetical protein